MTRCRNTHDIEAYLASKPTDIRFPLPSTLSDQPPFVPQTTTEEGTEKAGQAQFDETIRCPVYDATGECKHGLKCRFLGAHGRRDENGQVALLVDEERKAMTASTETEVNFVDAEILKQIRTKKVGFASYMYDLMFYTDLRSRCSFHILLQMPTSRSCKQARIN